MDLCFPALLPQLENRRGEPTLVTAMMTLVNSEFKWSSIEFKWSSLGAIHHHKLSVIIPDYFMWTGQDSTAQLLMMRPVQQVMSDMLTIIM